MKTILLTVKQIHGVSVMVLLMMVGLLLPCFTLAQDGRNDATFNTFDNVSAQGPDNSVSVSAVQPDNKILIAGNFTSYNGVTANKFVRILVDGKIDKSFNAGIGTDGNINTIAVQSNNKIMIGGDFTSYNGTPVNKVARLNANGSIDKNFKAGIGADNSILKIVVQSDEKILVAGRFTKYNNIPAKGLVRLYKNGSVDTTFNAGISDSLSYIHQMALLSDGKIIITGKARNFNGDFINSIITIRLTSTGERDYTFQQCKFSVGDLYPTINSIGIESDGNLLLAGTNEDGGSSAPYHGLLIRVNERGEILKRMGTFWINSMMVLNDGKIMALGFDNPDWGIIKRRVVRMNKDLTIDSTFILQDKNVYADPSESSIQTLSLQLDGRVIVGGNFFEINGLLASNIARLTPDGKFDDSFNQRRGCNGIVYASAVSNGKVIIGGEFSRFNYQPVHNLTRLKKTGEWDSTFDTGCGTNGKIYTIAVQSNGKILIGGDFTSYNGNSCGNIVRLNTDGSYDKTFKNAKTNGIVRKITIDKNDKIIIGGDFTTVNSMSRIAAARILQTGTLDNSFQPVIDSIGAVYDCSIDNAGKIYVALNYKNTPEFSIESKIVRFNSNGTRDQVFHSPSGIFFKINSIVLTDNKSKVLAAGLGYYSPFEFFPPKGIITKLSKDGTEDTTDFNKMPLEIYLDKEIRTISLLTDDRIVIGGDFSLNKTYMNHIGLLSSSGVVDQTFAGSTNGNVYTSLLSQNNKAVIGGAFTEYAASVRNGVARISFDIMAEMAKVVDNLDIGFELSPNVYPNPAVSTITVDHLESGSVFKIYNASGIEMFSGLSTSEKPTVELSDYANGIYFMIAEKNGVRTSTKFIVSK
jgi:uncharacterized delta-60 repeat protein